MSASELKKILAAWLALPLTALDFAVAWDRTGGRVPMKTDGAGRVLAWASTADALKVQLGVLAFVLVFCSAIGALVLSQRPDRARGVLWLLAGTVWAVFALLNGLLWTTLVP